jgi:cellulose synthase/poly-beta-1,6-N-acetylglucosamine synthase-like glycosyltransferase
MIVLVHYILYIVEIIIAFYMVLPLLFLIIYGLKKMLGILYNVNKKKILINKSFDFAVVITAHKEIKLVPPLVDSLLKQSYSNYVVYVVADACDNPEIGFQDPKVCLLKPEPALNSKIKSIDFAINNFQKKHDAVIILDSDNLVHPDFLAVLNSYFQRGFKAVQSHLMPKNLNSIYARLDAAGNIYYNFTEREIRMELGFSSAIWGLGIAIETDLYKQIIYKHFLGGFDKRIQADIVKKIPQLAFAREAYVYDEKIDDGQALEKQRTRWIHAYFKYFGLSLNVFFMGIKRANLNLVYFGFINLRPPLFILVLLSLSFIILNVFISKIFFITWLIILIQFIISFVLIVYLKSNDRRIPKSLFYLPLFVMRQIFALLKIKRAKTSFLQTEHSNLIYIEDILKYAPGKKDIF